MFDGIASMDVVIIATLVFTVALVTWKFWIDFPSDAESASDTIIEAAGRAEILVAAAEQLWLTGRLPKSERLTYVMQELQKQFPNVDVSKLEATVEAAVYWLKFSQQ